MEIIDSKKTYRVPKSKVVEMNVQSVLCQSVTGCFGVSDRDVEKGDDSVWGENPGW